MVDAEVRAILEEAFGRYKKGEKTYGVFNKDNDLRDFLREAEEEMLDVIVYMAFEIARARGLRSRLDSVHLQLSKRLTGKNKNDIERIIDGINKAASRFKVRVFTPDIEDIEIEGSEELHYVLTEEAKR